jgi:predicted short-subunit dehydrogenase-like oxidoreductase (DUF2520 family)
VRAWRSRDDAVRDDGHQEDPVTAERPRIGFVGLGRVGRTLAVAFDRAGWPVTAGAGRTPERRSEFERSVPGVVTVESPDALLDLVDILFVTVPDDAIAPLAAELRLYSGQGIVHTSGFLPSTVLDPSLAAGSAAASFHPLVAFADLDRALAALDGGVVAIEGDEQLSGVLAGLARDIGARPVRVSTEGKAGYHVAAVLAAGGFIGLLETLSRAARTAGLDEQAALAVYAPLARQALANAEAFGLEKALTGPIARGDVGTLEAHLSFLASSAPATLGAYVALGEAQLAVVERRGGLDPETLAHVRALLAKPLPSGSM